MGSFLPQIVFRWWKEDNTPASDWTAGFYKAGLDPIMANLKEIYSDLDQSTPIANPAPFDVEGKVTIVLGAGGYKLVIRDENNVVKYTQDNILGGDGFGNGFGCQFVDTIADLKALDAGSSAFCYVAGYFAALDGGHHMFRWNGAAAAVDNEGSIISPDSAPTLGRWEWVPDEGDYVRAKGFGVIPNGSTDRTARLLEADDYAVSIGKELLIEGAVDGSALNISGSVTLESQVVEMTPGFALHGDGSLTFSGYFKGGHELRFAGDLIVNFSEGQINDAPEQFGGDPSHDNAAAFDYWLSAGGGAYSLPPGSWNHSTAWVEPEKPIIYWGRIVVGSGPNRETGFNFPATDSLGEIGQINLTKLLLANGQYLISSPSQAVMVGDLLVSGATGNLTAQNVLGTNSVTSNKNVVAKQSGTKFAASGQIAAYSGMGIATSGTSETDLCHLVLPANTLEANGDKIRIVCAGSAITTNGGQNRRFRCLIGSIVLCDLTITNNGTTPEFSRFSNWSVVIELARSDSGNIQSTATLMTDFVNTTFGASAPCASYWQFDSLTFSSDQTIQIKSTASASGSITQFKMTMDYFPAPL